MCVDTKTIEVALPFCVIGKCTGIDPRKGAADRKWYETDAEAVQHASELIDHHGTKELYVVQVVKVVRVPPKNVEVLAAVRGGI